MASLKFYGTVWSCQQSGRQKKFPDTTIRLISIDKIKFHHKRFQTRLKESLNSNILGSNKSSYSLYL